MKDFHQTQKAEAITWLSDDPKVRRDKEIREKIRYPLLKKQMGLDELDTSDMDVLDVGPGPFYGVGGLLRTRRTTYAEPLAPDYRTYYPCENYINIKGEELKEILSRFDLIVSTNAIDHMDDPRQFLTDLKDYMKPGAFFAHLHAIDNAYSHPHEAHAHNVNPSLFHEVLGKDFETVWYMDYLHDGLTYGWRKQPAFSGLYRKTKYD